MGEPKEAGAYEGSFPAGFEEEMRKRSLGWAYQKPHAGPRPGHNSTVGKQPGGKATMRQVDQPKFLGKTGNWTGTV